MATEGMSSTDRRRGRGLLRGGLTAIAVVLLAFLAKRVGPDDFISRAKFNLFDGESLVGRVPLQVWEDSFNSTYKVANYDPPKGAQCQ